MSLSSLSIDQVLDIWSELSDIWFTRIDEEDPEYTFQFYAHRVVPSNPTIQQCFAANGPHVESWIEDTIDPDCYKEIILSGWGGLAELLEKFELRHSKSGYECQIFINGRRAGKWMGAEMLEVWRCKLSIVYEILEVEEAWSSGGD